MAEKLLQRKKLYISAAIVSLLFVMAGICKFFINATWMIQWGFYLFGLVGAATLIYLGRKKIGVKAEPAQLLLVLFMVWYVICCIVVGLEQNGDWITANTQPMADAAICTLFIFPFGCSWIKNREGQKTLTLILHVVLLGWTMFMVYVLVRMFQGQEIVLPNGGLITTKNGKYLQMNTNRNTNGAWAMNFFVICFYMTLRVRGKAMKAVYGLASGVHYYALVLSASRTSFLAALLGVMGMVGIAAWLAGEGKDAKRRWLITLGAALVSGTLFYLLRGPLFRLYGTIAFPGSNVRERSMFHSSNQLLSGREGLWPKCIKAMFSSPRQIIFGATPAAIGSLLHQFGAGNQVYSHNEILELILTTGFVGFGLCLAWFILILRDSWRMFFVRKEKSLLLCLPVIVLLLLAANMFEAILLFYQHLSEYIFFFVAGCVHGIMKDK